jgi:ribosomal protein L36
MVKSVLMVSNQGIMKVPPSLIVAGRKIKENDINKYIIKRKGTYSTINR